MPLLPISHRSPRGGGAGITIPIALTLATALAAGVAVLGLVQAGSVSRTGCVDPLSCGTASGSHLPASAEGVRLLPQIQMEGFRLLLWVLLAFVLLLLAGAVINLITLALSRASSRRGETALRAALGAAPGRIVGELLREAMRLVLAPMVAGVALGVAGAVLIAATWPLGQAPWGGTAIGAGASAGAAALLMSAVLLPWLLPARIACSRNLRRALAAGERSSVGPGGTMVRDGLVILQVAASLVLLTSAGMLLRGMSVQGRSVGASEGSTQALAVALPEGADAQSGAAVYARLLERVRAMPEVVDTSLASEGAWLGLGPRAEVTALCVECWLGMTPKQLTRQESWVHAVSPGFFANLGIPLLAGRDFSEEDGPGAGRVAIVSRTFAHELFPNGDPIGKEIRFGDWKAEWYRVVGLVEDSGAPALGRTGMPEPAVYLSLLQHPPRTAGLAVRTSGNGEAGRDEVERLARELGIRMTASAGGSLEAVRRRAASPFRWFGGLVGVLAAVMLVLAALGLHGLVSHGVNLRRREIGLRMALGAEEGAVVRMVVGRSFRLVGVGVVVGLVPLSGVARLLQTQLSGADPWDPAVYALLAALLGTIALLASIVPARRAAHVDPVVALRD